MDEKKANLQKEDKKQKLIIENNYTPLEYDPQYILMVNRL